jgi:hypothetical protein
MTFTDDDLLELKPFCERLEKFLLSEKDYIEGSLVVALTGGFGSGKTTFLDMWRNDLLERRTKGGFCPMPVMLNAWESDHCGDPLLAILAEMVKVAADWKGKDKPNANAIKEAAKDIGWFMVGLTDELVSKCSGVSPIAAGKISGEKKQARKVKEPDWINLYQERIVRLRTLKESLQAEFGGATAKLLVFVDELDRCRPDYAVNYLETIKHIFDIPGMVFVLAIDREQLESSARALYGDRMNFEEYFRKFRHREISLPPRTQAASQKFIRGCFAKFIAKSGQRESRLVFDITIQRYLINLLTAYELQPRQIQEIFRLLGHLMMREPSREEGTVYWGVGAASVVLCCLHLARPVLFKNFQKEKCDPLDLCREIRQTLGPKESNWLIRIMLVGLFEGEDSRPMIEKGIQEFQLSEEDITNSKSFSHTSPVSSPD